MGLSAMLCIEFDYAAEGRALRVNRRTSRSPVESPCDRLRMLNEPVMTSLEKLCNSLADRSI